MTALTLEMLARQYHKLNREKSLQILIRFISRFWEEIISSQTDLSLTMLCLKSLELIS